MFNTTWEKMYVILAILLIEIMCKLKIAYIFITFNIIIATALNLLHKKEGRRTLILPFRWDD